MTEIVEIQNNTDSPIFVSANRSQFSNRLYVRIGKTSDEGSQISPGDYALIPVNAVKL